MSRAFTTVAVSVTNDYFTSSLDHMKIELFSINVNFERQNYVF